jgi:transcriptional regulator
MYLRPVFNETNLDKILALIAGNPFGLLVTHGPAGLDASHVPFTVERDGDALILEAHLARANPQCAMLDARSEALAIFSGPHAYIAPGWYETQPAVPTWDYAAAHVHGTLEPLSDPDSEAKMLHDLAQHDPHGFNHDKLDADYRAMMLRGIRPFRLRGTRIEAQWKMSQNRSEADRRAVAAALQAAGNQAVADLITGTIE